MSIRVTYFCVLKTDYSIHKNIFGIKNVLKIVIFFQRCLHNLNNRHIVAWMHDGSSKWHLNTTGSGPYIWILSVCAYLWPNSLLYTQFFNNDTWWKNKLPKSKYQLVLWFISVVLFCIINLYFFNSFFISILQNNQMIK